MCEISTYVLMNILAVNVTTNQRCNLNQLMSLCEGIKLTTVG